ncbi:nicotinamide-nucleotide amidase [Dongia mobilis]|uniref:Nicotinamide-nucleotide amidase n=1 Tax=Dongia mobilis TaxID=578943 RepID=A0A4R6WLT4_9PROT|nr:nicotinamide-nucleotide amidohydrolase family protein [Dongia mobilis]TDQ81536.1 nicotinamide-nucleotide amidase [Dongia mobilis]
MDLAGLLELYRQRGLRIATAESCTGGLVAATLTAIAGSSDVFERGWVTYSNQAKSESLGVPSDLIAAKGAVSTEVAEAMAKGALRRAQADVAVSVTGIAGPGGGSAEKPVGLVFIGLARKDGWSQVERCQFDGDRDAVRRQTVARALAHLATALD